MPEASKVRPPDIQGIEKAPRRPRPAVHGEERHAVHQLMGDEILGDQRRSIRRLAEDVGSGTFRSEGRPEEERTWNAVVDQPHHAAVLTVDAGVAVRQSEVVVGPTRVDMSVDDRRVVPRIVGVARDVAADPARPATSGSQQVLQPLPIVAHVERQGLPRPESVECLKRPVGARSADLLSMASDPDAAPDRALRLRLGDVEHDAAGVRVHEIGPDVVQGCLPGQGIRAVRQRKDHQGWQLAEHERSPGLRLKVRGSLLGGDARDRFDVYRTVHGAENGDGHAAVELPGHAAAVNRNPQVVLREALVRTPWHLAVRPVASEHQRVRPRHGVDPCVPPAQAGDIGCLRRGNRRHASANNRRQSHSVRRRRTRVTRLSRRAGQCPGRCKADELRNG